MGGTAQLENIDECKNVGNGGICSDVQSFERQSSESPYKKLANRSNTSSGISFILRLSVQNNFPLKPDYR